MQGTINNSFVSYNYNAGIFVPSATYPDSDTFIMSLIDLLKPQLIWSHRLTNGPHNSTQFFWEYLAAGYLFKLSFFR